MEGVKGKKCPVFILPLALESKGGRGTPAAALGRRSGGSRAAGTMGERVMGPWRLDSLFQFRRRGLQGWEQRPWPQRALYGPGRRKQGGSGWVGGGRGRGEREELRAPPTLGRGDARRRGDGSGGGVLQCMRQRRCGLGERSWRWRRWSWGEGAARGGPFIAEERRWRGRAWVEAGERCGAPLTVFGQSLVS